MGYHIAWEGTPGLESAGWAGWAGDAAQPSRHFPVMNLSADREGELTRERRQEWFCEDLVRIEVCFHGRLPLEPGLATLPLTD